MIVETRSAKILMSIIATAATDRMTIGSGTNEERMVRQNEFMTKAIAKMKQKMAADMSFGEALLEKQDSVGPAIVLAGEWDSDAQEGWHPGVIGIVAIYNDLLQIVAVVECKFFDRLHLV